MSSVSGSEQEAGKYGQGRAMSQQASANLSVPSSPLLDFNATKLVQHYHAAEYEYMAAQFLAVLMHLRDTTYYQLEEANHAALNHFVSVIGANGMKQVTKGLTCRCAFFCRNPLQ